MLGRDSNNNGNAPFGTTPHYITAIGMDKSGNIIVEDPDLPQETVKYSKNKIMRSTMTSIITGGLSGKGRYSGKGSESSGSTSGNLLSEVLDAGKKVMRTIYGSAFDALFGSEDGSTSANTNRSKYYNTTSSSNNSIIPAHVNTDNKLVGSTNAEQIWNYLISNGYSKAGAAGMMGNFAVESGFYPDNMENSYEKKLGFNDQTYTEAVNNGTYPKNKFMSDAVGYGLAQFTYGPWKRGLYENTVEKGISIGSAQGQLDYLMHTFRNDGYLRRNGLDERLKNHTNPSSAAMDMFTTYMMPNAPTTGNKYYQDRRKAYAEEAYNTYANSGMGRSVNGLKYVSPRDSEYVGYAATARTATAPKTVDFETFLNTIVTVLMNISNNTAILTKILEILSNNFGMEIDKSDIDAASKKTREQTQASLNELVRRSSNGNISGISNLLNNKDTEYIIAAMQALASE